MTHFAYNFSRHPLRDVLNLFRRIWLECDQQHNLLKIVLCCRNNVWHLVQKEAALLLLKSSYRVLDECKDLRVCTLFFRQTWNPFLNDHLRNLRYTRWYHYLDIFCWRLWAATDKVEVQLLRWLCTRLRLRRWLWLSKWLRGRFQRCMKRGWFHWSLQHRRCFYFYGLPAFLVRFMFLLFMPPLRIVAFKNFWAKWTLIPVCLL